MNYIFVIICSIILPILSIKSVTQKFCINCKFFKKDFMNNNKYGRCSLFIKENADYLVVGIEEKSFDNYYYCSTARGSEGMCGEEGKEYVSNK